MTAFEAPSERNISCATEECWDGFRQGLNGLNQNPEHHQQYLDLADEFEVFRAWARTSGAQSEDHASLDYRLRENPITRKPFLTILEGLVVSLSRCVTLLEPDSPPTSPKSLSSTSDHDSNSDQSWQVPTVGDFLRDISNFIDKLVQVSRAIKESSIQNRSIKAEAYEEWENGPSGKINTSKGFDDFIGALLKHRYSNLHESVRDRLRVAISRCNRRIAYQRTHQSRLLYGTRGDTSKTGGSTKNTLVPAGVPSQLLAPGSDGSTVPSDQIHPLQFVTAAPSQLGTNVSASTSSSNFSPLDRDDQSSITSGSSSLRMTTNSYSDLPPPPPLEGNLRYFECPYCCIQLPRKRARRRAWAHHVISDIQPYVCIFDDCSLFDQGFETEDDWLKHERWYHNLSWSCDGFSEHSPTRFRNRGEFQSHFEASHPSIISSLDFAKLMEVSATPAGKLFDHCPFCDMTAFTKEGSERPDIPVQLHDHGQESGFDGNASQRRMKRHILDHLLSLFQLALPPRSDVLDAASIGNTSKVDAETRRDPLESFDLIDEDYIDQQYVDPPLDLDENIPATLDDDAPGEYLGHATNPQLRSFVNKAMIIDEPAKVPTIRSIASTATGTLIDLVMMILTGLAAVQELDADRERLRSELEFLLGPLEYYLVHFGENPVRSFATFFAATKAPASKSMFSALHDTLWAAAYSVDIVDKGEETDQYFTKADLAVMNSMINFFFKQIGKEMTGEEPTIESKSDAKWSVRSNKKSLLEIRERIQFGAGIRMIHLNLHYEGREVIYRGDLLRQSIKYWIETHAILFDHYIILAQFTFVRDAAGEVKDMKYDVSEWPIPMDLLILESNNDAVIEGHTAVIGTAEDTPIKTMNLWPFRLRHLGKTEVYTLGASTSQYRENWCAKILEAKEKHAKSLNKQKTEPFRFRVVADTAFATRDTNSQAAKAPVVQGTPLHSTLQDMEQRYNGGEVRLDPIVTATITCATTFLQPNDGCRLVVVGTDYGVYTSEYHNPRAWTRCISVTKVTQIAVLEESSLFLLISDKSLIAYPLPVVYLASPPTNARHVPQKLSDASDVGFFAIGQMHKRNLIFYEKRKGIASSFKILEPVIGIGKKSSVLNRGTESFRDYDEFHMPSKTSNINLFCSSIAISTSDTFMVMTLDEKVPFNIPDLTGPDVSHVAERIRELRPRPLGMFRLTDAEFLLVYDGVALYVNKHGDISRSVIMEFVGHANQACLVKSKYLVLIGAMGNYVEVRNAMNGRLKQVISGKDVRLLDDGANSTDGKIMISMQHPYYERSQLVLEMTVDLEVEEEEEDHHEF